METVQKAYNNGIVVVATSTTNEYVVEELLGKEIEDKGMFARAESTSTR
jgi:hypothetical protein